MSKAVICPGVCGLKTEVTVTCEDGMTCKLHVESQCPAYKNFHEVLPEVDSMAPFSKVGEGAVYEACRTVCKHGACPVPVGIVKAVEVAGGMAVPKDVQIILSK